MPKPPINLDLARIEGFIHLGSPLSEIADYFGVSEAVIRRATRDSLKRARAARRLHLRKFQWEQASKGNITMLVLLGKLELGQGKDQAGMENKTIVRRMVKRR